MCLETCDDMLVNACRQNDAMSVMKCLQMGSDPNLMLQDGKTPLFHSSEHNQPDIMEHLLKFGANVNMQVKGGLNPLYAACCHGHVSCVSLLLLHNADPYNKSLTGSTPIAVAEENGHLDVLRLLGAFGVNFNKVTLTTTNSPVKLWIQYTTKHHWTPIDYALDLRSFKHINWLISNGLAYFRPNYKAQISRVPYAKPLPNNLLHYLKNITSNWTIKNHRLFVNVFGKKYVDTIANILLGFSNKIHISYLQWIIFEYVDITNQHITNLYTTP